jgi:hypothetical protein
MWIWQYHLTEVPFYLVLQAELTPSFRFLEDLESTLPDGALGFALLVEEEHASFSTSTKLSLRLSVACRSQAGSQVDMESSAT